MRRALTGELCLWVAPWGPILTAGPEAEPGGAARHLLGETGEGEMPAFPIYDPHGLKPA